MSFYYRYLMDCFFLFWQTPLLVLLTEQHLDWKEENGFIVPVKRFTISMSKLFHKFLTCQYPLQEFQSQDVSLLVNF